jgi:hypothetical protein
VSLAEGDRLLLTVVLSICTDMACHMAAPLAVACQLCTMSRQLHIVCASSHSVLVMSRALQTCRVT